MKIHLSDIDYNPHRDLEAYPIGDVQVAALVESINQTGFWDNLLVRPHPDSPGRYQLAYGHHRLKATKSPDLKEPITGADIPCRALSDDEMLHIMIKENSTQAGGQSIAAILDSVKAVLRYLSYEILRSDYGRPSTIVEGLFDSEHAFEQTKRCLLNGDGLGEPLITSYDTSLSRKNVEAALLSLKADGSMARILTDTLVRIKATTPDHIEEAQQAAEATAAKPVILAPGLDKYFDNTHQFKTFIDTVTSEGGRQFIPVDQQEDLASSIHDLSEKGEPMSAAVVRMSVQREVDKASGVQRDIDAQRELTNRNEARNALTEYMARSEQCIEDYADNIKAISHILKRYPELRAALSSGAVTQAIKSARKVIDDFEHQLKGTHQ